MTESLFDRSAEYDEMLQRGLQLSGEDKTYFLAGRVEDLRSHLPHPSTVRRILDFGCGIGDSSSHLAEVFAQAEVVGKDNAERAMAHAREKHGGSRVQFVALSELRSTGLFDLCYVNGVFHHIPPAERPGAIALIASVLRQDAHLALFENNPWNLGTRLVMSRIPFDRDAQPLSVLQARRLLRAGGFSHAVTTRFLFYFPRPLARLRFAEPWLAHAPLGAQYYVLARKRGTSREP